MNLEGKTEDELAQLRSDAQNALLLINSQLMTAGETLQRLKLKALEVDKEKTEAIWMLKCKRREYNDKKIELDMIVSAFWASRRGK